MMSILPKTLSMVEDVDAELGPYNCGHFGAMILFLYFYVYIYLMHHFM